MLELLLVVVIIGILAAITVPTVSGTDVARVKSASRGLMQLSRYARTMAVLNQQTMLLEISSDGKVEVKPKGRSASGGGDGETGDGGGESFGTEESPSSGESDAPTGSEMTELETKQVYRQIAFEVELDNNQLQEDDEETGLIVNESDGENAMEVQKTAAVVYAGNGRCLPYRVTIAPTDGNGQVLDGSWRLILSVDRFGNARILDDDR